MKEYLDNVVVPCLMCGINFETLWMMDDGMPIDLYCSEDCEIEYYSKKEIRNRKLKLAINGKK